MANRASVKGNARSLLPFPITRRTICWESTAVTGSVIVSVIRKPYEYINVKQPR